MLIHSIIGKWGHVMSHKILQHVLNISVLTISEKNCTIALGKLLNQRILEISLYNLSIKLISVPRYEKTNSAEIHQYPSSLVTWHIPLQFFTSAVWIIKVCSESVYCWHCWHPKVPVEGLSKLILCEYPGFQNFDDEVFRRRQDVIVVGVAPMSLAVVQVSVKPQTKQTPVMPQKQNMSLKWL